MNDESKKIEKIEQDAKQEVTEVKPADLAEQDLDEVAGGGAGGGIGGVEVGLRKKPYPGSGGGS